MDSTVKSVVFKYRSEGMLRVKFKTTTQSQLFHIKANTQMDITFTSYGNKRIQRKGLKCIESHEVMDHLFDNDLYKLKVIDCIVYEFNRSFTCLPLFLLKSGFEVSIDRHLQEFGYKFCALNQMNINYTLVNYITYKCYRRYKQLCIQSTLETNAVQTRDNLNYTQFNLIPNYYIEPQIIEDFAIDLYGLIYNIGGTIGMWIGLSMISINSLTNK